MARRPTEADALAAAPLAVQRMSRRGDAADRTDGKVAQALIGDSGEDGVRLVHTITRKIVEPDAKTFGV